MTHDRKRPGQPRLSSAWALAALLAALGATTLGVQTATAATGRLVPRGVVTGLPTSDGHQLISSAGKDSGRLLTYNPVTGARSTIELGTGCGPGESFTHTTTVRCPPAAGQTDATAYALDTWTGARTALPALSGQAGSQWVEYFVDIPEGGRPGTRNFLNYRTGARATIDIYDDRVIDLDSVPFRYVLSRREGNGADGITGTTDRSLAGRFLYRRRHDPQYDVVYASHRRAGVVRLAYCQNECTLLALSRSRAAWVDGKHPHVIVSTDLHGRARRTWRTEHASVSLLVVADRLFTALPIGRTGTYRISELEN